MRFLAFRIVFLLTLFIPLLVNAQPGDPQTDPDPVPIQGLLYLLAAGAVLGLHKILGKRKT
jgi:hypothetical protein